MQINKIKKLKNGKYKLETDNYKTITTYDNVILDNNLLFEKTLDNQKLNKIDKDTSYYDIYNKVIKMVGRKLRSEKEIRDFLEKNGLSLKDIDGMVQKFKENKIIDDEVFAKAYIHDRIAFSNDGILKIKQSLEEHNIDSFIIDRELSLIDQSVFDDKIKKFVQKKLKTNHKYSKSILKKRLALELKTNGYTDFNIDSYVDSQNNADILKKECSKLYNKLAKKYSGKELSLKMYKQLYQKGFSKEEIETEIGNFDIFE